jgi:CheY-like chemotaxis protein
MAENDQDVQIIVVEDDDVDRRAIVRAIRKRRINNPIIEVSNGVEALECLRGNDEHGPMEQPYLILLDLNMPKMGGIEFLQEIRKDEKLQESIVFVLTTSDDQKDKMAAYDHFIAGYIVKSEQAGDQFVKLVTMLENFVVTVKFPGTR